MRRLDVLDVHKSYGEIRAVGGVSLHADPGEIVALLGRNGAGKSTLIGMIAGRHHPDSGEVLIDGEDLAAGRIDLARRIGYAPQETGVYEFLPGRDTLRFFGELYGLRGRTLRERIEWAIDLLDLGEFITRPCEKLSGGERRRIHAAAAILHRPGLLLLDEPTVGADLEARAAIMAAVRTVADTGTAVIYTTHYLPEVAALDARIVIIDRGRIAAEGNRETLIADHGTASVELIFDGEAPRPIRSSPLISWAGDRLLIRSSNAPVLAGRLLARLGHETDRLVSMETHKADLDAVFLAVTGREIAAEDPR